MFLNFFHRLLIEQIKGGIFVMWNELCQHIGETVTIYTTSGGPSGGGFTGVLMSVNNCQARLVIRRGPTPCCAIGDGCCDREDDFGSDKCQDRCFGAVADIPLDRIACFVHNAI